MRILVVDDQKFNLKLAESYIKMASNEYSIILCENPLKVMGILEEEPIDIILLDIMMPEISGVELLKEIRLQKKYNDIQIIILTALTDNENFIECFEAGANDYIRKPIEQLEFHARLKAAVMQRKNSLVLKEMLETAKIQNSELKELYARLKDTQFHLVQSEKMAAIGELAAGIAHEINNPAGYISGNLETLAKYAERIKRYINHTRVGMEEIVKNPQPYDAFLKCMEMHTKLFKELKLEAITEDLESIIKDSQEGIKRISDIVNYMMSFSDTGDNTDRVSCSINELIRRVLLVVSHETRGIADISFEPQNVSDIICLKGQLEQVFLNIIINSIQAVKSKNEGNGSIVIKTYMENENVCCSVTDNGIGIPEEHLDKVFNPFFTTRDVGQGKGLGLSISHDIIVNKHGGIIDIKSQYGYGSEFIIKLKVRNTE